MKKLSLMLLAILSFGGALAQGPPPPGHGGGAPASGRIYGKLLDSTGRPIGQASVMVLKVNTDQASGRRKDQLLKGSASQNNGDFSLEDLPIRTPLKLTITALGYKVLTQELNLSPQSADKDLGNLHLVPNRQELQEVTVTATKPAIKMDMEKKVFNVSKDIVSVGGTGLDILKNVPSINVDIDGNISLRGGSPQLLVDGKPTTLTLDEIPSDAIESVEVITNPSARYDASGGGAGILNIVLKKNRKTGYNGSIRAGVDSYGGANGGASINIRENKINFSADINARSQRDRGTGSIDRYDQSTSPATYIDQQQLDTSRNSMYFGRIGLDYFLTNRTTLSLTSFAMHHGGTNTSNIGFNTDSLYNTGKITQFSQEEITSVRAFTGRGATLGIKQLFAKDKEEWTADASYFSGNVSNNSQYVTNYYTGLSGSPLSGTQLQRIESGGNDHNIILQTDFTDPLTPKTTLETGIRAALQDRLNINNNYTWNSDSAAYLLVPSAASNYKSQTNIYAAYLTLASSIGTINYKLGLRAESSNYNGTLLNSGQHFSNQYPLSLFPSVFLSRKIGESQEIQLSYTRRVNRPNFFQLVPYTDSSNKLNITRGNPDLVPEFTQSAELSYLWNFPHNGTLMGSVYYKHTDHLITGYIEVDTNASTGSTTLVNTYINAESSNTLGAELTAQLPLAKWWDLSANLNIYHSKVNVDQVSAVPQEALWSWFGKLNTSFRLTQSLSLQLSGIYQSKSNLPVNSNTNQPGPPNLSPQSASQGYIASFYTIDMAVKKTFLAGKMAISLSANDIFRTKHQDQYTYSAYFTQTYSRLRDPQMLRLNLSYNFGKIDASLFKRKNTNVQSDEQ